ncbi:MAG: NAD-dependent protein deacylase [Planctomycetales bacterium]|nr:NAD-dependent protein deacylase [Planctomycetales bacterium]
MSAQPNDSPYKSIAHWLELSRSTVVLTGAGISTESGIPDFRSPSGVWAKYAPVYFDEFLASAESRHEYWRHKCEAHPAMAAAQPNLGHEILARWESAGRIAAVITQNIDGLHQLAGSRNVLELHGTAREIACLDCHARFDVEPLVAEFLASDRVPLCPKCRGRLKHATVSFGQQLPPEVLMKASALCAKAELIFAVGSSLVVHPAAGLPRLAVQRGARLVIVNRDATELDSLANCALRDPISVELQRVDAVLGTR